MIALLSAGSTSFWNAMVSVGSRLDRQNYIGVETGFGIHARYPKISTVYLSFWIISIITLWARQTGIRYILELRRAQ